MFHSTNVKLRKPSPNFHLTFTWASDHHLTFPGPSSCVPLTLT